MVRGGSAEVKEEYITLQGRLLDYSVPHNSKVKSHFKFIELDINASQACIPLLFLDGGRWHQL